MLAAAKMVASATGADGQHDHRHGSKGAGRRIPYVL